MRHAICFGLDRPFVLGHECIWPKEPGGQRRLGAREREFRHGRIRSWRGLLVDAPRIASV